MATKINESVWGTVPATGAAIRVAPNSLGTCYNNGTFNPDDINSMDKSIVPWGVPYCGLGGMSFLKKLRMPIPIQGTDNMKAGTLTTFDIEEFIETNNPIVLMSTGSGNTNNNNYFSYRMSGAVNSSSTAFTSNAASDRDENIPTNGNAHMWNFRPIVYLDYQKVLVQVNGYILWDRYNGSRLAQSNLSNLPQSGRTWDDYELLGFSYTIYYRTASNSWTPNGTYITIPINEKDTSKYVLDRYFGQEIRPQKWTPYTYFRAIKTTFYGDTGSYQITSTGITKEADSETLHTYSSWTSELHSYGNYINGSQSFDNISYSMEKKCGFMQGGVWFEIVKGSEMPGSDYYSQSIQMGVYYKIKDYEPGTSKASAWAKIIAHEMAFLGLPFQIKISGDAGTPAATASIADDDVFLPIFDMNHMVTTGRYTTDISVKQAQANYAWNNIFDSTVPDWDSSYNPPKPSGGGDDDDFGDLTNSRPTRYGTSGTKKYVCSASTINSLQSFLNVSYTPDNSNFIADFKGTNPADYIVSIQRYPFPLPHLSSTAAILIGGVDTALTANPLESELYQAQRIFDFGSIEIPEYYGDFRDYESKITLFLPFIGSVELDPRLFIGHLLTIDYIIDYDTGSIAAEIQRDGLTIETKTAHISITIPFFAADMGAYQNALAQTEFAIEQSKIKQISGIASTAISAGGAIAGAGAGLSDIGSASVAGGLIGGTASMLSGLVQMQSLEYQLDHTAPSIGTLSVAAPANAFYMDDRARVLIIRPKMLSDYSAEDYSHTVGNACAIPGKLGSFTGYTVAAAADLSGIPATAAEKALIRKQLQAGVYV